MESTRKLFVLVASLLFLVSLARSQNGRFSPSLEDAEHVKSFGIKMPQGMMTFFSQGNVIATSSFVGPNFEEDEDEEYEDEEDATEPTSSEVFGDKLPKKPDSNLENKETTAVLEGEESTTEISGEPTSTSKPQRKYKPKTPQYEKDEEEKLPRRRKPVYNTFFPIIFTGNGPTGREGTIVRRPLTSISNSFSNAKKGYAISTTDIRYKLEDEKKDLEDDE